MKHNVFLGSGSGSIGDVVSYRREGTQVSRMRVREIKNPRTYNQAEQRNFLAPVSKFYAPLAGALEQSFEGKSTAKSYAAFSSAAVKKARLNGWFLPKGTGFFPLPYQLSQGTLPPLSLYGALEDETYLATISLPIATTATGATVGAFSKALVENGYKVGDQVTVISVLMDENGQYFPSYGRIFIDPEDDTVFNVANLKIDALSSGATEISFNSYTGNLKGYSVIISRYENEKWRRSTQSLLVNENTLALATGETAKENAIASYMDGEYVPISEVYLNGSTANQQ